MTLTPDVLAAASEGRADPEVVKALAAEVEALRASVARLNRRAQVAEAAVNELATGTGKGKARPVAVEVWQRCVESHGRQCPAVLATPHD